MTTKGVVFLFGAAGACGFFSKAAGWWGEIRDDAWGVLMICGVLCCLISAIMVASSKDEPMRKESHHGHKKRRRSP